MPAEVFAQNAIDRSTQRRLRLLGFERTCRPIRHLCRGDAVAELKAIDRALDFDSLALTDLVGSSRDAIIWSFRSTLFRDRTRDRGLGASRDLGRHRAPPVRWRAGGVPRAEHGDH